MEPAAAPAQCWGVPTATVRWRINPIGRTAQTWRFRPEFLPLSRPLINVVNDGRLLSLQAGEWLMLIVGGLAVLLILMF